METLVFLWDGAVMFIIAIDRAAEAEQKFSVSYVIQNQRKEL